MEPMQLRDYQVRGLEYISQYRSALVGWGMGTGKTLLAVERAKRAAEYLEKPLPRVLVVAPLNTHYGWQSTIERQWPGMPVYSVDTPSRDQKNWQRMEDHEPGVFIIGWEAMHGTIRKIRDRDGEVVREIDNTPPWRLTGEWDVLIADECHRMQNRKSLSAQVIKSINANFRVAMSGTPAGNKVEGIWSSLNFLWRKRYRHFWPWVNKRLKTEPDQYAYLRVVGEKSPGSATEDIPCFIYLELEDVMKLPGVAEHEVMVEMGQKQRKVYESFEREAFAWLNEQPVGTSLPITQRIRLRQVALGMPTADLYEKIIKNRFEVTRRMQREVTPEEAAEGIEGEWYWSTELVTTENIEEKLEVFFDDDCKSPKIDALKEIINDLPDDEPVMVYCHSKRFVTSVVHQLNKSRKISPRRDAANPAAVAWTGDTPQADRMAYLRTFGRQGPRIIVAVISAISEGTDGLQHVCANEVWLSRDDNNIMNTQAAARLHRSGQERMVNRWHIHSVGSIDHRVYETTDHNYKSMKEFYRARK